MNKPETVFEEDFETLYANTVRFESSVFDLKLIFGRVDQTSGTEVHKMHTAITIPWPLVKIAAYYLNANLMLHESINGRVLTPPSQVPPPYSASDESSEDSAIGLEVNRLHAEAFPKT